MRETLVVNGYMFPSSVAMAQQLGVWITNPVVLSSKQLGYSLVNLAFYP